MMIERFRYAPGVDVKPLRHIALMKVWVFSDVMANLFGQFRSERLTSSSSSTHGWISMKLVRYIMQLMKTELLG